jgi:hypothetical protein
LLIIREITRPVIANITPDICKAMCSGNHHQKLFMYRGKKIPTDIQNPKAIVITHPCQLRNIVTKIINLKKEAFRQRTTYYLRYV